MRVRAAALFGLGVLGCARMTLGGEVLGAL